MLDNIEITTLRQLEDRRAQVLDRQNALVVKLREAVEHIQQCYDDPEMTQTRFAAVVLRWHELLTLLAEQAASEAEGFVLKATADMSPEEMEEHEPGGYIAQRLTLLDAARTLSVRNHTHMEAIHQVMSDWFDLAGVDMPAETATN